MRITIPARTAEVYKEVDVLVVGGGPAGIGAAVAAAQSGGRVLLLEKRGFLGGNITGSYVETCNHFLGGIPGYRTRGVYARLEDSYRAEFGSSHDIRPGAPHRFSSEYLKVFLDSFVEEAGVEISLHSFVNEVVVQDNSIAYVIIQSKQGPVAVKAKTVIDCTGDGDVAVAAGIPFEQGRAFDGKCQPGTLNFRIAGVDPQRLTEGGRDMLKVIGKRYREDYRAGKTGLSCKRQDIPCGRLTPAGQVSYVNYPCAYGIDPTHFADLTRGEMECRRYILEVCAYMKEHFEGFENLELSSIATEIGFRDSRRIQGQYKLTIDDMESGRHFDDVIATFPRFYDMLSPDANMNEDTLEGGGGNGYICLYPKDERTFEIPYRCLLPVEMKNLLVAGRCISADHVAESGIRAITACMYTGQAAGTAAAMSAAQGCTPETLPVGALQQSLRTQGLL